MIRFLRGSESERGQAIVLVAITMTMLLMMVGLAVDAGQLYSSRRTMQEAADAGAYAGAVVLYQQGTQTQARAAAVNDVTLNGYTHNIGGFEVIINAPPTSGPFTNNNLYVEVIIQGNVRTQLLPEAAPLTFVRVRAVAGSEPLNNQYAIMALDRGNTPSALNISSNGDVHLNGGGILVNSTSATAATNAQTDACRLTIGPSPHGVDIAGNTSSTWPAAGCPARGTPAYLTSSAKPQQADPFAGFPKPSTTGMLVHNALPTGTPLVLDPGVWTVPISAAGGTVLYLKPGIYVLKAGINAAGNADLISMRTDTTPACAAECGVFIFNTHTNYPGPFRSGTDSCGPLSLVGNGASDLRAQTTGTYKNFLFYQDAACTNEMYIAGNGTFNGTGSVYLPNAHFRFDGNPSTLNGSQLIAKTVNIQNGNITINFSAATSAQPILPRLAE